MDVVVTYSFPSGLSFGLPRVNDFDNVALAFCGWKQSYYFQMDFLNNSGDERPSNKHLLWALGMPLETVSEVLFE